tara:strand:+ start:234 stop:689 length:456 start_codon:yes stop_codon:yes gene_type:complete
MSVTDAVEGLSYQQVRSYLMLVQKISTPGKGMKQLITTISERDNLGAIIKDLNTLKQKIANLKTTSTRSNVSIGALKRKRDGKSEDDDEDDEDDDGLQAQTDHADNDHADNADEDDAMIMLKEELALRGLTTKGKSYPFLVKRLVKALRNE